MNTQDLPSQKMCAEARSGISAALNVETIRKVNSRCTEYTGSYIPLTGLIRIREDRIRLDHEYSGKHAE